ncbi:acetyl esterase [Kitasatospora sp. GAS204A]|uniref:alpha/beta hydrolase n=1 Tax=unclassified Kitasatospora TaxID=2633591 RepID=UPI002476A872|nr:alpha/beta hydrolase [Kitasatospora sp. GAS204B]MDH6117897.1 acetyl esterase [Kitasatospora sp. GAS204B]
MSDTAPSHARRPVLEGALQAFVDARARRPATEGDEGGFPGEFLDLSLHSAQDGSTQDSSAQDGPDGPQDTIAEWYELPGGPTGPVRVQVVRPVDAAEPTPVVLFLHGIGWALGDAAAYGHLLREFAVGADAAVVFVDYARAPVTRYPVAVEQCYAVAQWIHAHGGEIGLDGRRIAAVGDSAGANLVAALTVLAQQRGGVRLVHQVLLCPVTDADFDTPSYREFADGYVLHRDDMRRFWDAYLPDVTRRREATAAPLHATMEQLAGLPPALVVTAEADVLRDEGEAYAARLRAAGVPVVATRYQGVVHGFLLLDSACRTGTARAAFIQAVDTVHVALHRYPG